MNADLIDDVPLLMNSRAEDGSLTSIHLGWFPPDVLRPMISRKEARFERREGQRCVILTAEAPALLRAKALSSSGATQALSTTYTENLYPDSPEQLARKKQDEIAVTVTATIISLKKYKGPKVGFVPWTDDERFRRRRYNPDTVRPQFWSARAAEQALRPQTTPTSPA